MWGSNNVWIMGLVDKMAIHFNVVGTLMEDKIRYTMCSTCVICMKTSSLGLRETMFRKQSMKPKDFRASRRQHEIQLKLLSRDPLILWVGLVVA